MATSKRSMASRTLKSAGSQVSQAGRSLARADGHDKTGGTQFKARPLIKGIALITSGGLLVLLAVFLALILAVSAMAGAAFNSQQANPEEAVLMNEVMVQAADIGGNGTVVEYASWASAEKRTADLKALNASAEAEAGYVSGKGVVRLPPEGAWLYQSGTWGKNWVVTEHSHPTALPGIGLVTSQGLPAQLYTPYLGSFVRTVSYGLYGLFGTEPFAYAGEPPRTHKGIDLWAGEGRHLTSVQDGIVIFTQNFAGFSSTRQFGTSMRILHPLGNNQFYISSYLHMQYNSITKPVGSSVKAGDIIGREGDTGFAFGSHLHFQLNLADAEGNMLDYRFDPTPYWFPHNSEYRDRYNVSVFASSDREEAKSQFKNLFMIDLDRTPKTPTSKEFERPIPGD